MNQQHALRMNRTPSRGRTFLWMSVLVSASAVAVSCSDSNSTSTGTGGSTAATGGAGGTASGTGGAGGEAMQSLYDKYGGAKTVATVVTDAVTGLLADCQMVPYFSTVGMPGHDSAARLSSCLRLQFTALLGGPATYPGVNDQGDTCVDMKTIHTGLQIPGPVFDRFVTDLAGVLATDGVSATDIGTIASALAPIKPDVVSPTPVTKSACGGTGG